MYLGVVAIHVVLCLLLILIIILQPGKGGEMGSAFGGAGGASMFGPRGQGNFLSSATTWIAVGFFCTSVVLAIYSNRALLADSDVLEQVDRVGRERQQRTQTAPADGEVAPAVPGEAQPIEVPPDVPVIELEQVEPAQDVAPE